MTRELSEGEGGNEGQSRQGVGRGALLRGTAFGARRGGTRGVRDGECVGVKEGERMGWPARDRGERGQIGASLCRAAYGARRGGARGVGERQMYAEGR